MEKFIKIYNPEKNTSLENFLRFGIDGYNLDSQTSSLVQSLIARFGKLNLLGELLSSFFSKISEVDVRELETHNYTPAKSSKLAATIFEAMLNEYYSIYDNYVKILQKIYPDSNLPKRMSKLINRIPENNYSLPKEVIEQIILIETLYEKLNKIRTETVHFSTGSISGFEKPISYMNDQIGPIGKTPSNTLLIKDVPEHLEELSSKTKDFINFFFIFLLSEMEGNKKIYHVCGFYNKLLYERIESYNDFISEKSGICNPFWLNSDAPTCPQIGHCRAYHNYRSQNK